MSHIETATTKINLRALVPLITEGKKEALAAHPCIALLREALNLVAKEAQGEVKSHYLDYDYREQPTNTGLALHIPRSSDRRSGHAIPRGIGLEVNPETGALEFKGDAWRVDEQYYKSVQQKIVQKYTVLAQMAALRRAGYQVATQAAENGSVRIKAVAHVG